MDKSMIASLIGIGLLFICCVLLGVIVGQTQASMNIALREEQKYCPDSTRVLDTYCSRPQLFGTCFDMVNQVEALLRLGTPKAIFDQIKILEGPNNNQTGPFTVWAVNENTENENNHLDSNTAGIADYFNNSAYFYSQRVAVNSANCGGWSLSFWKTRPPVMRSYQLVYCEDNTHGVRVCGAFNIFTQ